MGLLSLFKQDKVKTQHAMQRKTYNVMQKRMYEAARSNLVRDIFSGGDIDEMIESQSSAILRRAREAYANNDYVKGYISMACTNIIGHKGIRIQCKSKSDTLNTKTELGFARWSRRGKCDVTGQLSLIDVQLSCVRSLLRDGEFFVLKHVIDGQLQLQLIDSGRIDVTKRATLSNGNKVINGVELNHYGKPQAYYLIDDDGAETIRIAAENVIHGFISEYIGQKRGISTIATALIRLGLLKEFETAAVDNARSNAKSMGFFKKPEGEINYNGIGDEDYEDDFDIRTLDDAARFHVIEAGYDFTGFDAQFPSTNFAPFKESILKAISSSLGYGVNYINLGNDLKGVSYSSARQGLLSERDAWRMLQTLLIDTLMRPLFESWLDVEYASGRLGNVSVLSLDSLIDSVRFQTRSWAWIDPLKDAKGTTESINNHTISLSQAILDAGGDPEDTLNQIAIDNERLKELGIVMQSVPDESAEQNQNIQKQIEDGISNAELYQDD
ncbi:phage portal protein [Cysteiniphilum halobium]|uniref:phage portal protein n=1 Tax=Cysteiniphilum halobium TaxID=2219059 RepID=UPI003F84546E